MLALTILGSNSALAAYGRNPTAQVLQSNEEFILIDCGEGTQMQMAKYKIKKSKISHIFISHLHGDHYFGLIGLLSSMALQNRVNDLHLFGPPELIDIINLQLKVADSTLPYKLYFHALGEAGIIADLQTIKINSFKVSHRINCWGFIFQEKTILRSLDPEKLNAFEVPSEYFNKLQNGEDYKNAKGTIISNDELTKPGPIAKKYCYCADTKFDESIVAHVKDCDLLYHETTYLKDKQENAVLRFHSTTVDAGTIANKANVKKLIIGHFSSKYEKLDDFLNETCCVFENTELAIEGSCFRI
ncbi:MAG: ribonuclease Z [Ferruginibacter sp.]